LAWKNLQLIRTDIHYGRWPRSVGATDNVIAFTGRSTSPATCHTRTRPCAEGATPLALGRAPLNPHTTPSGAIHRKTSPPHTHTTTTQTQTHTHTHIHTPAPAPARGVAAIPNSRSVHHPV